MKIELEEGAILSRSSAPRRIGHTMKLKTKRKLYDMVKKDIVEIVPMDHRTEWCHPFCPRMEPNGGIRLTVDLIWLNDWIKRPEYPVTTPYEAIHNTRPGSRFFTLMGAKNGCHQIPFHKDYRELKSIYNPLGSLQI